MIQISAKQGIGIKELIETIIREIPAPKVNREGLFRALLFDSWYDRFRGTLSLIYIHDGKIKVGEDIKFCHTQKSYQVRTLGVLRPQEQPTKQL